MRAGLAFLLTVVFLTLAGQPEHVAASAFHADPPPPTPAPLPTPNAGQGEQAVHQGARLQVAGWFVADYFEPSTSKTYHFDEEEWWYDVAYDWGIPRYESYCYDYTVYYLDGNVEVKLEHNAWLIPASCSHGLLYKRLNGVVATRLVYDDGTIVYN